MQTAVFRVNASTSIGLGHLMRCLALAQALNKEQFDSVFLVNSEAETICQSREDWVGKVIVVPSNINVDEELSFIAQQCNDEKAQVFVLDGYQFDDGYRANLKPLSIPIICFDDSSLDSQNPPCCLHADIIINGVSDAVQVDYQQANPTSKLCVGDKFRVLRDEFVTVKTNDLDNRKRVTISMGGSDPLDLSRPLLIALKNKNLNDKLTLITGAAYANLDWLKEFKQYNAFNFEHIHDCQHIAQVFADSRWVISAAGGSQFELQSCGAPASLLIVADNQLGATSSATKQGWCTSFDCRNVLDNPQRAQLVNSVVEQMIAMLHAPERLQEMSRNALLTADVLGAKRVVSCIKQTIARG